MSRSTSARSRNSLPLEPPVIEPDQESVMIAIYHDKKTSLSALRKILDGSTFSVKSVEPVKKLGNRSWSLMAKLRKLEPPR